MHVNKHYIIIYVYILFKNIYKTASIVTRLSMITKLELYLNIINVDKHYIIIYAFMLFKNIYKTAYKVIRLYMSTLM